MDRRLKIILKKSDTLYHFLRTIWHKTENLYALIEAFLFKLTTIFKTHNDLLSHVEFGSLDELISYIRESKEPRFFFVSNEGYKLDSFVSDSYKDDIVAKAEEVVKHKFRILGQRIYFDPEIDWHVDPQSGYRWPLKYYKRLLPVFKTSDNTDGKLPYELSRFNHLNTLGIAYRINGKKKYIQEFVDQIESWLDSNPYRIGINWTCAMDVSIRVCNMISAFSFFKNCEEVSDAFMTRFGASVYQHGRYIIRNLEWNEDATGNHYLSNIVGLIYVGVNFPEFREAKKWKEFAIKELINEMEKQVYPDGSDFEASTCYHRLALELFFFSTLLLVINDTEFEGDNYSEISVRFFGKDYTNKLYKMFQTVLYLLKPNGRMPQIGDNDSGRLHILREHEVLDMRYLLSFGAIFFREYKFKIREFGFCEEALLIFGEKGYSIWQDLEENCLANVGSRVFQDAGWYINRHNKDYCFISCGPNGQNGNGGHAHNDKLSFELMLGGQDIIVDPGTYVYTSYPKERNKFRSTEYHNTIKFNGYEQNEISEQDMFRLHDRVKIKKAALEEIDNKIVFQGEIQYAGITHKRKITFDNESDSWQIQDNFYSSKPLGGKIIFHLSPILAYDANSILIKEKKDKIGSIKVTESNIEKVVYDYSPEYGVKVRAECLVANISSTNGVKTINTYIHRI